jgi:pimeloyl-ACP methyl ester carboxylesterase
MQADGLVRSASGGLMFVTSRGFRIHYQAFGDGPAVVLLHGFPMWGDRWIDRGYVDGLHSRFRVIVPDLLGHGQSDKPHDPGAYGNPNLAADVRAVLDAEGIGAAHVWGYSWGTVVAENLAAGSPGRVASLVLGGYPLGLDAAQRAAMAELAGQFPATIEEYFADWPTPLAELFIARNDFGAMTAVRQTIYAFPTTVTQLQAAGHPTLAYCGADDDDYMDLCRQQAQKLPCHLETVPGDHKAAFAQAANILPAAIAHIDAAEQALISR